MLQRGSASTLRACFVLLWKLKLPVPWSAPKSCLIDSLDGVVGAKVPEWSRRADSDPAPRTFSHHLHQMADAERRRFGKVAPGTCAASPSKKAARHRMCSASRLESTNRC